MRTDLPIRRQLMCGAAIIGLASFSASSPAISQVSGEPAQAPQDASTNETQFSGQLEDIVVTAQFRSQNLQKTPLAITATTASMMEARSQTNIVDVAVRAPSVTLSSGGQQGGSQATVLNVRGVGQSDFNLALEPGVGMYIDDVYYGTVYASTFQLLDLERVEVLRGPQGTLAGKNSEGGAIKMFSKKPDGEGGGFIEGTYGSFKRTDVRAAGNFTLIPDTLFARVSGVAFQREGFVDRLDYQCVTGQAPAPISVGSLATGGPAGCKIGTEGSQEVVALRGALRWIVTPNIENLLSVDVMNDNSGSSPTILTYQGSWHGPGYDLTTTPPTPNTPQNFVLPYGSYANYANYAGLIGTPNQYIAPATSHVDMWGISNILDITLNTGLSLKSITSYRHLYQNANQDADGSPLSRLQQNWTVKYNQFTQELRLSGDVGDLADWTLGAYYFSSDALQGGRIGIDGAGDNGIPFYVPADFTFNDPVNVKSKAAFANVIGHLAPGLNITGGLRYTDDKKTYTYTRGTAPGVPLGLIVSTIVPLDGASGKFAGNRWDYRVAVDFEVTPDILVYAQTATGFKGGGINPRPYYEIQVRPFDPETLTSYELGLKTNLFDRRARINVAGFYNKVKKIQQTLYVCPQYVPAGATQNCSMTANVGDGTIKGIEVETELRPIDGMIIDGSLSYVDYKYDRIDAATKIDINNLPTYTPKWKYSIGAQYKFDIGQAGSITPRFDYIYQSGVWGEALNSPRSFLPHFGVANARVTYRSSDQDWEFSLAVTNVFDKYYFVNSYDRSPPIATSYDFTAMQPGRPREWAVTVKRNF